MFHNSTVHHTGLFSICLANASIYAAQWCHCGIDLCTGVVYSPYSVIMISGVITRLLTLPLTLYGDRCLSRLACALPELYDAHTDFDYVNKHPRAISWEKRVAAEKLSSERKRIWDEYKTNNSKTILPYFGGLCVLWGLCRSCGEALHTFYTYIHHLTITSPLSFCITAEPTVTSSLSDTLINSATDSMPFISSWSSLWFALTQINFHSWSFASFNSLMTHVHTSNIASATLSSASSSSVVLCVIDPTLCIAASCTLWGTLHHLRSRTGFNARMDKLICYLRRWAWRCWGLCVASSLCYGPCVALLQSLLITFSTATTTATATTTTATAAAASSIPGLWIIGNGVLPSYVIAFWVGASLCNVLKRILINSNTVGKRVCAIMPYPASHGQYGNTTTNDGLLKLWDVSKEEMAEREVEWVKQRVAYEYECDVRIHKLLYQCGLFTAQEDAEFELHRVKERRRELHDRKLRESEETNSQEPSGIEQTKKEILHDIDNVSVTNNNVSSTCDAEPCQLRRPRREWEINSNNYENTTNKHNDSTQNYLSNNSNNNNNNNDNNNNSSLTIDEGNMHVMTSIEELEQIIEEERVIQERKYVAFMQPTTEYDEEYKAVKRARSAGQINKMERNKKR